MTTYTLENTGNVRVGTDTLVRVAGPFGALASETAEGRRELLPGQRVTARTEVPVWGLVRARAEVTVDATAVGEDPPLPDVAPGRSVVGLWAVPWAQVVVLLLAAALLVVRRRRRRRAERAIEAHIDAAVSAATSRNGTGTSPATEGQKPDAASHPRNVPNQWSESVPRPRIPKP